MESIRNEILLNIAYIGEWNEYLEDQTQEAGQYVEELRGKELEP